MTVSVASSDAVVKIVFRASRFVIDFTFALCLGCFFSVGFVDLGMLHDVLTAKSSAMSSTHQSSIIRVTHFSAQTGW